MQEYIPEYMSLDKFRSDYKKIIDRGKTFEEKQEMLEAYLTVYFHSLPLFCSPNLNFTGFITTRLSRSFEFRGIRYSDYTKLDKMEEIFIDPQNAIGHTWLYLNDRSEGKPNPYKLSSILLASPAKLEKVSSARAGDYFECNDGNHRIYAAYLLGRPVGIEYKRKYTRIERVE